MITAKQYFNHIAGRVRIDLDRQLQSFRDKYKGFHPDWVSRIGRATGMRVVHKMHDEADCEDFVGKHEWACCNHWHENITQEKLLYLKKAKQLLHIERIAGGCEGKKCPFAGMCIAISTTSLRLAHMKLIFCCRTEKVSKRLRRSSRSICGARI